MPIEDRFTVKDRSNFDQNYKDKVFTIWYTNAKPNSMTLQGMIPVDDSGRKPSRAFLNDWVSKDFLARAVPIDEAVVQEMNNRLMQQKIEMLERHAEVATEMQDIALTYLREHKDDLTPISAVRLLVESVKIEKGSRGIPQVLEKMMNMSDEDLLKETTNLLLKAPITEISPIVDVDDEPEEQLPDL